MNLVIVESPTKARTLSKFLGDKFKVLASMGHVRDLPKSKLGVDVEHGFEPQYLVPPKAKKVIKVLKDEASKAEVIWLSTDPDREGEAIAWHIAEVLGPKLVKSSIHSTGSGQEFKVQGKKKAKETLNAEPPASNFKRAVFHEITQSAVKEAFENPRELDLHLVDSQQARRVLDRLVGYKLSPLLWKKVARNLSAGRVQSVAVRLIVERERERQAFKPQEYWKIFAILNPDETKSETFAAQVIEKAGKRLEVSSEKEARNVESELKGCDYKILEVKSEEKKRYPSPPFTTSTLQQAGVNKLGFSAGRTMRAAQALYEQGLITYMRTDSVVLSGQFLAQAADFIKSEYGQNYAPAKPIQYKTKSRVAQEAHEAIRPTDLRVTGSQITVTGADEKKVYSLIYNRALASQMNPAVFDSIGVDVLASRGKSPETGYTLRATGSVLKFDGWLKVWGIDRSKIKDQRSTFPEEGIDEEEPQPSTLNFELSTLKPDQFLLLEDLRTTQHFTEPPGRYTEATLVKKLEEEGIGRPSTYAPILSTIQYRGYIGKEGRYLFPEDLGFVVNDLLVANFPKIVDVSFTSQMEADLDQIAEGKKEWVPLIRDFYTPFERLVAEKEEELKKQDFTTLEKLDEKCPECGKDLIVKIGKFGKFISCSGFPDCKFTKPLGSDGQEEKVDQSQLGKCPNDGGELIIKRGRFGQFVACQNYPNCKFTKPYLEKIGVKCPQCGGGDVIVKRSRFKKVFYGCSRYPECKYASWTNPSSAPAQGEPGEKEEEKQKEATLAEGGSASGGSNP